MDPGALALVISLVQPLPSASRGKIKRSVRITQLTIFYEILGLLLLGSRVLHAVEIDYWKVTIEIGEAPHMIIIRMRRYEPVDSLAGCRCFQLSYDLIPIVIRQAAINNGK